MKVSVIVLTYNSAATIRQALDSVLTQRCDFEYEIVVGDDASTDSTREILLEYAAKNANIRLLLAPTNQGLQNNYYDCLEASRGTYIADCAGDDFWNNADRLQLMADALDRSPKVGMVYTDWIKHDLSTGCEQLCHPTLMSDISRR
ncbi:MAG: glycosyltransferase, partial [Muribaculaceae bacterium]|nr:glycosyltransferase [Muribaculaceae bacterium]